MKKIVALVLAMVMVLGLATTAFAYKGGTDYEEAVNGEFRKQWSFKLVAADKEEAEDKLFATYEIEATALVEDAFLFWEEGAATPSDVVKKDKEVDVEIDGQYDEFVKIGNADMADFVLIEGKEIIYLMAADKVNDDDAGEWAGWDFKAEKHVLPVAPKAEADWDCDTKYAFTAATSTFYKDADGYLYTTARATDDPADEDTYLVNVGGVAYFVTDAIAFDSTRVNEEIDDKWFPELMEEYDFIYSAHNFAMNFDADSYVLTQDDTKKVFCDLCKHEFKFVVAPDAVARSTFGEDNYFALVNVTEEEVEGLRVDLDPALTDVCLYVEYAQTTSAGSDAAGGDKVESPKTFDAGIAMYVGMSVMAAAGSAVVLKKKD